MSGDDDIPNVYIQHGSHSVDNTTVHIVVEYPEPSFLIGSTKALRNFDTLNNIFYEENDYRLGSAIIRLTEKNDRLYIATSTNDYGYDVYVNGVENAKIVAETIRNIRVAMNNNKRMSAKIV